MQAPSDIIAVASTAKLELIEENGKDIINHMVPFIIVLT